MKAREALCMREINSWPPDRSPRMANRLQPKWKKFERLVAAIHAAEMKGARVAWDEKIKGRQFDVVIRFRIGSYDYVTGIECRDKKRPVSAEQVEALVTKSSDAGIDKAVMASSSGFQSGALVVAERHNIGLYTLQTSTEVPEEIPDSEVIPVLRIHGIGLRQTEPPGWRDLPEHRNLPEYLAVNLTVSS